MASKLKAIEPVEVKPRKPIVLIFGDTDVGKSYGATGFPNNFYCDSEGGAIKSQYIKRLKENGSKYFGPDQGSMDPKEVLEQVEALATEKHNLKTFTLDSISKIYNTEISKEQERMEKNNEKDAFGASKKPGVSMTRKLTRWINRLDMVVILIAHQKALWKDGEQVGETFDAHDKLGYELDLVLQIKKQGARRVAYVKKSRFENVPSGTSFDWDYESFADKFGKGLIEAEATPIVLATKEQLAEINELLENVKLPDGQIDKWFKAADVDSFAEMDTDKATKIIVHLTDKLILKTKKEETK